MENVSRLIEGGNLLADNGSYSRAFFLYFTAMEEAAKAYFYAAIHTNIFQYDEVRSDLVNHLPKTALFFWFLVSQRLIEGKIDVPRKVSREQFIEGLKEFFEAVMGGKKLREASLYVDLVDDNWNTPLDFQKEESDTMKDYAMNFVSFVKDISSTFFRIPREMRKELPIIRDQWILTFTAWGLEGARKNNILTEQEYEEAKMELREKIQELQQRKKTRSG